MLESNSVLLPIYHNVPERLFEGYSHPSGKVLSSDRFLLLAKLRAFRVLTYTGKDGQQARFKLVQVCGYDSAVDG